MPRCISCNRNLNNMEATRRHAETGEFLDLCDRCLKEVIDIEPELQFINNPLSAAFPDIEDNMGE